MPIKPRKARKPGTIKGLKVKMWRAVVAAEEVMYTALEVDDFDRAIRANTALTQAGAQYYKILEASDVEKRLQLLETLRAAGTAMKRVG